METRAPTIFLTPRNARRALRSGVSVTTNLGNTLMVSTTGFLNTRCTFHRVRDARILHGWVESFDDRELAIRLSTQLELKEGEEFYFQVFGLDEDACFMAQLTTQLKNTFAWADPANAGTALCMFAIRGEVKTKKSTTDPRLTNQSMTATIKHKDQLLSNDPMDVIDVSLNGLSFNHSSPLPRETTLHVRVSTLQGEVEFNAEVRNVRELPNSPGVFRHGVLVGEMHRIDRLRWQNLFRRSF